MCDLIRRYPIPRGKIVATAMVGTEGDFYLVAFFLAGALAFLGAAFFTTSFLEATGFASLDSELFILAALFL
jgi:hypothetical protein